MKTGSRRQKAVGRQTAGIRGWWLRSREKADLKCQIPCGYRTHWLAMSLIVAAVFTVATVRVVAQGPPQNEDKPRPVVTVRVYDYAEASHGTMSRAEGEASRIVGSAGVTAAWLDCLAPRVSSQLASEQTSRDCGGPLSGATIALRILPRWTAANTAFRDTMFGYADGTALASVFYARVEDLAHGWDGNQQEIPVILGDVIAHEIGHLLLGSGAHSKSGIMCGQWDATYVRRALMGLQVFSPKQSERIQAEVVRRSEGSEVASSSSRH
jgi:hypothetical protein